jgi:hypothetical protein
MAVSPIRETATHARCTTPFPPACAPMSLMWGVKLREAAAAGSRARIERRGQANRSSGAARSLSIARALLHHHLAVVAGHSSFPTPVRASTSDDSTSRYLLTLPSLEVVHAPDETRCRGREDKRSCAAGEARRRPPCPFPMDAPDLLHLELVCSSAIPE